MGANEPEVIIDVSMWNIMERWMKAMEKLEKVVVENGITYVLGEDNLYYPDLRLPEGTNYPIGKFGHMRCEYLKEFKHGYYMELLLEGKLNEYLHEIDEECLMQQELKKRQGRQRRGMGEWQCCQEKMEKKRKSNWCFLLFVLLANMF